MKSFKTFIAELFNSSVPYRGLKSTPIHKTYAFNVDGLIYSVAIENKLKRKVAPGWEVSFSHVDHMGHEFYNAVEVGTASALKVFSTVIDITMNFIEEENPETITLLVDKHDPSRISIYRNIINSGLSNDYQFTEIKGTRNLNQYIYFVLERK